MLRSLFSHSCRKSTSRSTQCSICHRLKQAVHCAVEETFDVGLLLLGLADLVVNVDSFLLGRYFSSVSTKPARFTSFLPVNGNAPLFVYTKILTFFMYVRFSRFSCGSVDIQCRFKAR